MFQRRIIMTGTPVANRPYDIWAQIYFLDFGESLGADFNEFKKETDLSNKLSRNTDLQEEFEDNISQIFNRISSFTVRETKIVESLHCRIKYIYRKLQNSIVCKRSCTSG